ncbi:amino acid ABC transporter permease [Burkholderia sp. Ap-962]|uniref:amino acid ABC transporter permease n=1 Tax=Burkholderia sp. Ap-962 TaxID=2608333 RepID=UPI001423FD17|nr:amino acid ABC transporter permease [Burkholderia sp. Ap-962]NIF70137.1 amino acid ABC transporter permease [Burkholderia sp. Ap-962]
MSLVNIGAITSNLSYLLVDGFGLTLKLTVSCASTGFMLGAVLAVIRLYGPRWARWLVASYVNLVRSIPLILVIFWVYFLSPYAVAWLTGASNPVQVNAYVSAFATFSLFEACYYCEIIRAGVLAIPNGQAAAARALGLNGVQVLASVILPQAIRHTTPILILQAIVLFQDVSLVYVLSLTDFVGAATQIAQQQNSLVEMYLFVALVYFATSFLCTKGVHRLQQRLAIH